MRNVRQMVNRVAAGRLHDRGVCRVRDVDRRGALPGAAPTAAAWRGRATPSAGSRWRSAGSVDPADPDCVSWSAPAGRRCVRAFLHFVPWGTDGMSLDLMRRDRTAEPGRQRAAHRRARCRRRPTLGVKRVSLNFAAFRSALERGERLGAGPMLAGLAPGAALRLALVPDRVALPVQRQVPAAAGSRASSSTRRRRPAAGRPWPRSRPRRSSPGPAGPARGRCAASGQATAWLAAAGRRPARRHGRRQRHPRLVLRRRRVVRAGRRRSRTGCALLDAGRRPGRRRRRVHPTRRRAADRRRRSCAGCSRSWPRSGRGGRAWSPSTRCAPRSPPRRLEAGAGMVNDVSGGLADPGDGRGRRRRRGAVRRHALARAQHPHAVPGGLRRRRRRRVPRAVRAGWRPWCARGDRRRADRARPRLRLRQAGRAQLAPAAGLDRLHGARPPGAGGTSRKRSSAGSACRTGCPAPTAAERDAATAATTRASPPRPGRGACGCTTCPSSARRRAGRRVRGPATAEPPEVHRDRISLSAACAAGASTASSTTRSATARTFVVDVTLHVDLSRAAAHRRPGPTRSTTPRWPATSWPLIEGESLDLIETLASADRRRGARPAAGRGGRGHRPQARGAGRPSRSATSPVTVQPASASAPGRRRAGRQPRRLARAPSRRGRPRGLPGLIDVVDVSPVVETDPVGGPDQPAYLNAVRAGPDHLAPCDAAALGLHAIEAEHGRAREVRWGAADPGPRPHPVRRPGDTGVEHGTDPDAAAAAPPRARARLRARAVAPRRPRGGPAGR